MTIFDYLAYRTFPKIVEISHQPSTFRGRISTLKIFLHNTKALFFIRMLPNPELISSLSRTDDCCRLKLRSLRPDLFFDAASERSFSSMIDWNIFSIHFLLTRKRFVGCIGKRVDYSLITSRMDDLLHHQPILYPVMKRFFYVG